ncbi:MAG: response regulator transcription factor [Oscillospiraceae bacterium]|nr:response regulator transcription factor [Oscillospiraceae bacterium]
MIDVFIVDDSHDVRESLIEILNADPEIRVVGEADNGEEAIKQAKALLPELILMDIKLPGMDGLESVRHIKKFCNEQKIDIKIVILSTFYDDDYVLKAHEYGIDGYLLKGMVNKALTSIIKSTCNDLVTFDRLIYEKKNELTPKRAVAKPEISSLSKTELEILKLIVNGKKNSEIASDLFFSEGTVRNYVSSMLAKLGCKNGRDLAVFGIRAGL